MWLVLHIRIQDSGQRWPLLKFEINELREILSYIVEKPSLKNRMMQLMRTHEAQLAESYDVEIGKEFGIWEMFLFDWIRPLYRIRPDCRLPTSQSSGVYSPPMAFDWSVRSSTSRRLRLVPPWGWAARARPPLVSRKDSAWNTTHASDYLIHLLLMLAYEPAENRYQCWIACMKNWSTHAPSHLLWSQA